MSSIVAEASLKTTGFKAGLDTMRRNASEASKEISKKFSGKDLFRGLMQGLGIGSVSALADKLIEPFKAAAEASKNLADYTDRAVAATMALINLRRTDSQILDAMDKDLAARERNLAGANATPRKGGFSNWVSGMFGGDTNESADADRLRQDAELKEGYVAREKLADKIAAAEKTAADKLAASKARGAEIEFEASLKTMSVQEQINAITEKRADLLEKISSLNGEQWSSPMTFKQQDELNALNEKAAALQDRVSTLQSSLSESAKREAEALAEAAAADADRRESAAKAAAADAERARAAKASAVAGIDAQIDAERSSLGGIGDTSGVVSSGMLSIGGSVAGERAYFNSNAAIISRHDRQIALLQQIKENTERSNAADLLMEA